MSDRKIRVLPNPDAVAREAAELFIAAAGDAIDRAGRFSVVLSGGSTPEPLYRLLSQEPYLRRVDWAHVEIFFSDERCVPPSSPQSNFRMADEALLSYAAIPPAQIHRMRGEIEPEQAAREYGMMLKERFADAGPDLALLGMGDDGHTASLFPGDPAPLQSDHRCVAVRVEKLNAWRITLTPLFLNRSAQVLVLVTGSSKAARLQQVLEGDLDALANPIQSISPTEGKLTWLLDTAAADMS